MIILGAIDGTSSEKDEQYQKTFADSFVKRLANMKGSLWSDSFYHRGPYTSGKETAKIAETIYKELVKKWRTGEAKAIFLTGYSRGAAAVIEIAMWLRDIENIPVECLILFDPVDRTWTLGKLFSDTPIVSTVKQVIHMQRDINKTNSRLSFGACGLVKERSSQLDSFQRFFATHGGLGGVPWVRATDPLLGIPLEYIWEFGEVVQTNVTPRMDAVGSLQVWGWVFPQILNAWSRCKAELEKPATNPPAKPFQPMPIPNPLKPKKIHTVVPGDWLSKIAITYYKDMSKWTVIYEANKTVIGNNPDLIKPGMQLVIP